MRRRSDFQLFLRRSEDINRAKRIGRRVATPCFNVMIAPSESSHTRLAIVVGRKFGRATVRNRAKRRIRELARSVEERLTAHYHVVIFPKAPVVTMPFAQLKQVWDQVFQREGLFHG